MKKLFTLALVLLVTVAGYSQVKKVYSSKDQKVATMQQAPRMETEALNYVQSEPNMTRSEGDLDYSYYDWQTNAASRTWTHVWPDGKVNFAYTVAGDDIFSDRGTGIGTYDAVNDEWIPSGGRVETEKTGFGCIAQYGLNGLVVAAHTSTECGIYLIEDKDNITEGCAITLPKLENSKEPTWPVVMTSGPNRDIIHVLATAYSEDGQPVYYYRTRDCGQTWDKENVVIPYLSEDYVSDWGSNICYFLETTEDNCLAFVVNNAWSDGMVVYSFDDGETWERKVFYQHAGINASFSGAFLYPRWASVVWTQDYKLNVLYEFNGCTGDPGSGSYYPGIGGVSFWSEDMPYRSSEYAQYGYDPNNANAPVEGQPFMMDTAYLYQDIYSSWPPFSDGTHVDGMLPEYIGYLPALTDGGEWESWDDAQEFNIEDRSLHGSYNCGCVAFPVLCKVPGADSDLVAVWSAMDENNKDGNGNHFFKLFASYSGDGGMTWTTMKHITNSFMYQYSECVYNQAAIVGNTLIIASQMDAETGTYVMGDDADGTDNYYQGLTFDLTELFGPTVGVPEVQNNNVHMSIYPNPAVDQLNVTLSKGAKVVVYNIMGQAVRNMEGQVGANVVDLSGLNAGVYFISAGSDTQKFIVK